VWQILFHCFTVALHFSMRNASARKKNGASLDDSIDENVWEPPGLSGL
jgi:hypothetical protein